jgi:hypothetical protein
MDGLLSFENECVGLVWTAMTRGAGSVMLRT